MFIYSYTALSHDNNIVQDFIISKNKKSAFIELLEAEQTPLHIRLKAIFILNAANINYRTHFFYQLNSLVSSGINLLQSLYILQKNTHSPFWQKIITSTITDLKKGNRFSDSLRKHPDIFTPTIISLISVAEKTGNYENNFKIIAGMLKHNEETKKKITKSLRYPIVLTLFSIALIFIMLVYVLPQFETIYQSFQHELPLITKIMIYLSNLITDYFPYFLLITLIISLLIWKFKANTVRLIITLLFYVPPIKKLIKNSNLNIFFLTLSSTLQAGLPLTECLKCTADTLHNPLYKKESLSVYHAVLKGESLSAAVKNSAFFPSIVHQLIAVAEESGQLPHFLQYLFTHFSTQHTSLTEKSLKNLEPILLLLMAFLVGTIMVAMYLPIFNLGNVITGI
ncbi:type II secretion system F family protein [Providencia stuartii]|uniref:General secretion pathway protein F n=1 Tax=Providencia stuartii TaxID=588 RepID=A0AAJ1JJD4_PROST|nr:MULTISPECIES: type II secretion system F family protein [Providencia]EMA3640516.1 type II secretion system F family protein [Providencia stuartii]MBW3100778.1 type II secretion system F family protein [Providencia stuartii]MCB5217737.1 type II secretion system F family protein [Providencia stuartii]MDE8750844.1 type II secretion system F family protein [Providencia thailandensis]MDE8770634.1 type II secretion system F family protein [Providencia thailandensis]